MVKKKTVADDAAQEEVQSVQAAPLPTKVTLESDFTFWTSHHGAEITRQFTANQVVRDPDVIAALVAADAPLKD